MFLCNLGLLLFASCNGGTLESIKCFCLPSVHSPSFGKYILMSLGETPYPLVSVQLVWAGLTGLLPALGSGVGHVTQIWPVGGSLPLDKKTVIFLGMGTDPHQASERLHWDGCWSYPERSRLGLLLAIWSLHGESALSVKPLQAKRS